MELAWHALVVGAALAFVTWRGYLFSWQFEQGQRWDRYAPGLQPGSLFGRRVVSCFTPCRQHGCATAYLRAVLSGMLHAWVFGHGCTIS